MPEKDSPESSLPSFKSGTDTLFLLASIHCACLWVLTRKFSGTHAYSVVGPLALLMMLICGAAMPCPILLMYLPVFCAFVLYRRIRADPRENSRFRGVFIGAAWYWQALEAICFFVVGTILYQIDPALGMYVSMMSFSAIVVLVIESTSIATRLRRMRDAEVQMEYLSSKRG